MRRQASRWFICLAAALAMLPAAHWAWGQDVAKEAGALRIGWASADITPERPVMLVGSSHPPLSQGVADPISATVLVLESAREGRPADMAVLVSVDLCLFSDALVERVRAMAGQRTPKIEASKIVLNATHTHVAPGSHSAAPDMIAKLKELGLELPAAWTPWGLEMDGMPTVDYVEFAAARIAGAIEEAWTARKPGGVSFGLAHVVAGHNRLTAYANGRSQMYGPTDRPDFSHVEGYEDHAVNLLYTWDADRKLTGVVVNLALSSQVTGGSRISADYWCETRGELRARLGENVFLLPQCSAAGDQSPSILIGRQAEARMERLAGRTRRQQIAWQIADAVTSILPYMEKHVDWEPVVAHRVEQVALSRRRMTEEEVERAGKDFARLLAEYRILRQEAQEHPERKQDATWRGRVTGVYWRLARAVRVQNRFALQATEPTVPYEIHVIRLGDMVFATNPFELYLDFGIRMKARSRAVQTFVVQLAGSGYAHYLPAARSVAGGAYGAIPESNVIGPEGGQELVERTLEMIDSLWTEEKAAQP